MGSNTARVQNGLPNTYVKYLDRANLVITTQKFKKEEWTVHWTCFTKGQVQKKWPQTVFAMKKRGKSVYNLSRIPKI